MKSMQAGMSKLQVLGLLVCLFAVMLYVGHAQTAVQHSGTHVDAATQVSTIASSAGTLTLTPVAGQCVYITSLEIDASEDATGVAATAQTTVTTTNISGSPIWTIASGTASAGLANPPIAMAFPGGLKAATCGTAVTFVEPTFTTHQTIRINVAWYSAA